MDAVWTLLAVLAPFAVTMGGIVWLAHRVRTRGVAPDILGPIQDMWDPAVRHVQEQVQIQVERKETAPSPGDPPTDDDQVSSR